MSQLEPPTTLWQHLLSAQEEESLVRAAFSRRAGLGRTLAILVIDVQNYMVGPIGDEPYDYPSSCGEIGLEAVGNISVLLKTARSLSLPIFYTRFEVRADGADMGVYQLKRAFMQTAGWAIRGSFGARIVEAIAPEPQDFVLTKNKPSAFLGTPLHGLLIDRGVDTLIVAGGSTSNCVRATVVDAASLNYRVLIPAECVFDRIDISHRVALFDMDRQYGDVVGLEELLHALRNVESSQKPEPVTGRSQESR